MELSVKEALSIYPLSEGKLVAGKLGISRMITAINLMDAPDIINWMKEGELLLTTAYAIKDSEEEFIQLLQKLNQKNQQGLALSLDATGEKFLTLCFKRQTDYICRSSSCPLLSPSLSKLLHCFKMNLDEALSD